MPNIKKPTGREGTLLDLSHLNLDESAEKRIGAKLTGAILEELARNETVPDLIIAGNIGKIIGRGGTVGIISPPIDFKGLENIISDNI